MSVHRKTRWADLPIRDGKLHDRACAVLAKLWRRQRVEPDPDVVHYLVTRGNCEVVDGRLRIKRRVVSCGPELCHRQDRWASERELASRRLEVAA